MKFYKFWAPAEAQVKLGRGSWSLRAYGGSNQSLDHARRRAREVAERAASAISAGRPPADYDYAERPPREEIVEVITAGDETIAVITRNSYGSLVLNTRQAMFVDVDYPQSSNGAGDAATLGRAVKSLWGRLKGQPAKISPPAPSQDEILLARFEKVTNSHAGLGIRVYRTAAGYRLLATSQPYDPMSSDVEKLLTDFGSDALYMRLCKSQQCFRARLTAKYWRCGAEKPPLRYPWTNAEEESKYRQCEQAYHKRANHFAACSHIANFGDPHVCDEVAPIVQMHDRLTINDQAQLG
jgi:hypothetical protein